MCVCNCIYNIFNCMCMYTYTLYVYVYVWLCIIIIVYDYQNHHHEHLKFNDVSDFLWAAHVDVTHTFLSAAQNAGVQRSMDGFKGKSIGNNCLNHHPFLGKWMKMVGFPLSQYLKIESPHHGRVVFVVALTSHHQKTMPRLFQHQKHLVPFSKLHHL